jgi:tetratricopeptide (TPR) repeat protein
MPQPSRLSAIVLLFLLTALLVPPVMAIRDVTPTPTEAEPASPTPIPTPVAALDVDALFDEVMALLAREEFRAALDALDSGLEAEPENALLYLLRGLVQKESGRYERAIDDFTRTLAIEPWNWEALALRGDVYLEQNEIGQALIDYDAAIWRNPQSALGYNGRSQALFARGDHDAAVIDRRIAEGLASLSMGDAEWAIASFTEAIDFLPEDARLPSVAYAYLNRGLALLGLDEVKAAIDDLDEALALIPDLHDAYLARGIAHRLEGDAVAAGQDFLERMRLLETEAIDLQIDARTPVDVELGYGTVARLTFEGQAGQTVTIAARDRDLVRVDPLLTLLGPDGAVLAGDDDFGGELDALVDAFTLPADGTYTIVVSHANGGFTGPVRVTLRTE